MKTQRRHELQTNELADHIGTYIKAIRPYQNHILFGVVALVAIVVAAMWMNKQNQARASLSWGDYFGALGQQRPEALEDVAKFHNGSTAALWAQQSAGEMQLANGSRQIFTDRDEAEKSLKDAEKSFKAVEAGAGKHPELVRRARVGLGRVYEAMCDVEKAKACYKQVAEGAPESVLGKFAEQRFKRLSSDSVESWYAWFERQEPVLPGSSDAASGPGVGPLGDLNDLPERPDLSFPADSLLNEPISPDKKADAPGDSSTPADAAVPKSTDEPDEAMDDNATGETTEPETTEPETTEPETADPEMVEPDAAEPKTAEPETPEAPAAEQTEVPVADESASPAEPPASEDAAPEAENETKSGASPETPAEPASDESEPPSPENAGESSP